MGLSSIDFANSLSRISKNFCSSLVLEKKFGIKDRLKATIKPSDSNPV